MLQCYPHMSLPTFFYNIRLSLGTILVKSILFSCIQRSWAQCRTIRKQMKCGCLYQSPLSISFIDILRFGTKIRLSFIKREIERFQLNDKGCNFVDCEIAYCQLVVMRFLKEIVINVFFCSMAKTGLNLQISFITYLFLSFIIICFFCQLLQSDSLLTKSFFITLKKERESLNNKLK